MTSEQLWQLGIVDVLFLPRAYSENVKHLVPFSAGGVLLQETLRPTHLLSQLFDLDTLGNLSSITGKN